MKRTSYQSRRLQSAAKAMCWLGLMMVLLLVGTLSACADSWIYTDSLQHGWIDQEPGGTHSFNNTSPVYSGSYSIAATIPADQPQAQVSVSHNPGGFDATPYSDLSFELNGGTGGVDWITVVTGYWKGVGYDWQFYQTFGLGAVAANTWRSIAVPLPSPDVQDPTILQLFVIIAGYDGSTLPNDSSFYIDDIGLTAVPEPATATLTGLGLLGALSIRRKS